MTILNELFFELIRVAIGKQDYLSRMPSPKEWNTLYSMAKKQSLVGVCYWGLQRLGGDADGTSASSEQENIYDRIGMSEMLYMEWTYMAAMIQQRNEIVSEAVGIAKEHYDKEGFNMVLLKGQGNLCNYPEPIRMLRTPGDIDVWIMPKNFETMAFNERMKNDEVVLKHFWKKDPSIRHCYLHIHDALFEGIDVEVHYRPSYINAPLRNRRFQKWVTKDAHRQCSNIVIIPSANEVDVAVPTHEFNIIYQLSHLYRHMFDDGLGLRQILDYYFVIVQHGVWDSDTIKMIREFGMYKFCQSLMYVMWKVCGLGEEYLAIPPDREGGELLLNEIVIAGNFGHYDERERITKNENGAQRLIRRQMRNMRFLGHYTEEVLCVPIYRVFQEYWRIKMDVKCK